MNVLLVKMSSLGDIVHTLPAVTDAARRGASFDWVVEESYQPLPALVEGVDNVLPVALRRWRRTPHRNGREMRRFRHRLRRRRYDLVLDAQGLIKSAAVGLLAKGRNRAGFDAASVRERPAALAYHRHVHVPRCEHAIARSRRLFAGALDYELPATAPAFGLGVAKGHRNHLILAHGTTWHSKLWSERFWIEIAQRAAAVGLTPLLPWVEGEQARVERIASAVPAAQPCAPLDMAGILDVIAESSAVVGVDSGLAHLGAALGLPTVMLFGPTDPRLTGCRGAFTRNLAASLPCAPCTSRRCGYRRESATARTMPEAPCLTALNPSRVWRELTALMQRAQTTKTIASDVCQAQAASGKTP